VNIPSYQVTPGEEVALRERSRKLPVMEGVREQTSHLAVAPWLEIDRENFKGRVLALPTREHINLPINEQLIVELYSK